MLACRAVLLADARAGFTLHSLCLLPGGCWCIGAPSQHAVGGMAVSCAMLCTHNSCRMASLCACVVLSAAVRPLLSTKLMAEVLSCTGSNVVGSMWYWLVSLVCCGGCWSVVGNAGGFKDQGTSSDSGALSQRQGCRRLRQLAPRQQCVLWACMVRMGRGKHPPRVNVCAVCSQLLRLVRCDSS